MAEIKALLPSDIPVFSQSLFEYLGIRHFTLSEVLYRYELSEIPQELHHNIIPTVLVLDAVREYVQVPLYIVSSYRNQEHNVKVKGKPNSLHLQFNALDFMAKGYGYKDYLQIQLYLISKDFNISLHGLKINAALLGTGKYSTFMHIDTRGLLGRHSPSHWQGK